MALASASATFASAAAALASASAILLYPASLASAAASEQAIPAISSIDIIGNNNLTPGNPITLQWENKKGIKFKKKFKYFINFFFNLKKF